MSEMTRSSTRVGHQDTSPEMTDGSAIALLFAGLVGGLLAWRWASGLVVRLGWQRGLSVAGAILAASGGLALGAVWGALLHTLGVPALGSAAVSVAALAWSFRRRQTVAGIGAYIGLAWQAIAGVLMLSVSAIAGILGWFKRALGRLVGGAGEATMRRSDLAGSRVDTVAGFDSLDLLKVDEPAPGDVTFAYIDAAGELTERHVRVTWRGDYSFEGYCYMRKDERTFRYDRIVGDVVDLATGEVMAAEHWRP